MSVPAEQKQAADKVDAASGHADRAQAALRSNQPEAALHELKAYLKSHPDNANAWANLGMVQFAQGQNADALHSFEAARERDPHSFNIQAFLGMCQLRAGEGQAGQGALEAALPHLTDAHLRQQAGLELVGLYANGAEPERALVVLQSLLQNDRTNPDLLYATYRVHSELASKALQTLSQSHPDGARVHQILGDDFLAQENYTKAQEEYRAALQRDGHLIGIHLGLGQALMFQARDEAARKAAEQEFEAELQGDPENPEALLRLGQLAYEGQRSEIATDLFQRSLQRRPHDAEAHVGLARIFADQGNGAEAERELNSALKADPGNRTAHYRLALLYKKAGKAGKAAQEFNEARKLQAVQTRSLAVAREADGEER